MEESREDVRRGVRERMKVRDVHGASLGRVARVGARTFLVERGFPFKLRVWLRYDDVTAVRDGEVWMDETGGQLEAESFATPLAREPR